MEITEVKEKFGSLRVHLQQADALARPLIAQAEERSKTVCQICGADGELLVRDHHYITLCPAHGKGYSKPKQKPIVTLNLRNGAIKE